MYRYEKYNFRLFTPLLALMMITFIIYREYIGAAVSLGFGIFSAFSFQGVLIDGEKRRYMKYDRFVRLRIGRWEPFSTPSYVTVVRINLSSQRNMPSPLALPDRSKSAKSFKVNLVVEGRERFIPVCRGRLEPMKDEALRLGRYLGIRVLDYSTHEKHWIL